jgi:diaminopimelate epimerase
VWERGVGVTEACGTGAVATAVAANRWGLVGASSTIAMPGGSVGVEIDGDRTMLIGPTQLVCALDFVWVTR